MSTIDPSATTASFTRATKTATDVESLKQSILDHVSYSQGRTPARSISWSRVHPDFAAARPDHRAIGCILLNVADRPAFLRPALLTLLGTAAAACHSISAPQLVQPGAPGRASHVVEAERAIDPTSVRTSAADIAFMQGMIAHHAQAVEMVGLLESRTTRQDMRTLGLRIEVSQSDEIRMMQRWLEARGQPAPGPHAHHGDASMLMPGMLTAEEMARLQEARGPAFDRLFLEGMIKHHEGALIMVKQLFATSGAAQDAEIFAFASDVDSDQRMEIDRMRAMLAPLQRSAITPDVR